MLREQGYQQIRVATGSTADLALAVTPGAPGGPEEVAAFDTVVICTDAVEGRPPGDWSNAYQLAAGMDSAPVFLVTGSACANFVAGLNAARGLIAAGDAENVLLVMAERMLEGSRYTAVSRSVLSDAAVSCMVSAHPAAGSFQLLGTAIETRLPRYGEWNELADARTTFLALNKASKRAAGECPADSFDHLLTLNIGATARQLLAMSTKVPANRLFAGPVAEFGHCFGSDIPLNLRALRESGNLAAGARVLAVASSRGTLAAVTLANPGEGS
jgi:3-oxoacyl-[acyl-carrier-protein] synthase-3